MINSVKKVYKYYLRFYILGSFAGCATILLLNSLSMLSYNRNPTGNPSFFQIEMFIIFYLAVLLQIWFVLSKKNLVSNGISRKSIFISNILASISVSPIIAITCIAWYKISSDVYRYKTIFEIIFRPRYSNGNIGEGQFIFEYAVWIIASFLALCAVISLFAELFYRIGKKGKVILITFLSLTPIAIVILIQVPTNISHINSSITDFIGFRTDPIKNLLFELILVALFYAGSYLVSRRSPIKDK